MNKIVNEPENTPSGIVSGTTKSGFPFHVDTRKLNNWQTMRRLAAISRADEMEQVFAIFELADILLGAEQIAAVEKHVENVENLPEGCASFTGMCAEIMEIVRLSQNDAGLKKS